MLTAHSGSLRAAAWGWSRIVPGGSVARVDDVVGGGDGPPQGRIAILVRGQALQRVVPPHLARLDDVGGVQFGGCCVPTSTKSQVSVARTGVPSSRNSVNR